MFLSLEQTNASNIEQEPDITIRHELLYRDFCVVKSQTAIVAWNKSDFPNILAVTSKTAPIFLQMFSIPQKVVQIVWNGLQIATEKDPSSIEGLKQMKPM